MDPALHRPLRRAPEPDPRPVHLRIQTNPSENPNAADATGTRVSVAVGWGGGHLVSDEVDDSLGLLRRRAAPGGDAAPEVPQSRRRPREGAIGSGRCGRGAREGEAPGAALDGEDDDAGLHRAARHGEVEVGVGATEQGQGARRGRRRRGAVVATGEAERTESLRLGGGGRVETVNGFRLAAQPKRAVGGRESASGLLDEDRRARLLDY